jgi:hypothetical protein
MATWIMALEMARLIIFNDLLGKLDALTGCLRQVRAQGSLCGRAFDRAMRTQCRSDRFALRDHRRLSEKAGRQHEQPMRRPVPGSYDICPPIAVSMRWLRSPTTGWSLSGRTGDKGGTRPGMAWSLTTQLRHRRVSQQPVPELTLGPFQRGRLSRRMNMAAPNRSHLCI